MAAPNQYAITRRVSVTNARTHALTHIYLRLDTYSPPLSLPLSAKLFASDVFHRAGRVQSPDTGIRIDDEFERMRRRSFGPCSQGLPLLPFTRDAHAHTQQRTTHRRTRGLRLSVRLRVCLFAPLYVCVCVRVFGSAGRSPREERARLTDDGSSGTHNARMVALRRV